MAQYECTNYGNCNTAMMGRILDQSRSVCPECGEPLNIRMSSRKSMKNKIIVAFVVGIFCVIVGVGINAYKNYTEQVVEPTIGSPLEGFVKYAQKIVDDFGKNSDKTIQGIEDILSLSEE